ncbi:hypothetical protein AFAEC_1163 [Aliarcobacter faecis]|uniref:hypothetical protein n=1 Tax=Aliarcobacter faecis TaxID=1564138 RepID=UPI00047A61BF|nr:hypothetical protein [Aliarcobacter faecis]QKF73328.1 hypothetical protein AFAEC_1163 [Aliarcobacter faecis]
MKTKIYLLFIALFIGFIVYGAIKQKTYDPKAKRVACQNSVTTFEKIFTKDLDFTKEFILSSNYKIESKIEYSKNMKSNLEGVFSSKDSDKILIEVLNSFKNSDKKYDNKLMISYYIYENDKEDKGKKNKDALLYAGYLVFEFKFEGEILYKIQIDYMKTDLSDIKTRINCVIESFLSI